MKLVILAVLCVFLSVAYSKDKIQSSQLNPKMERVYQPDITWPLAYLTRNNSDDIICSAGALSMRRFITATSCISSENLRELVIVAGRAIQGNNGGRYFIQEEVHDEDIAILILYEAVQYKDHPYLMLMTCLPLPNININNVATIVGWTKDKRGIYQNVLTGGVSNYTLYVNYPHGHRCRFQERRGDLLTYRIPENNVYNLQGIAIYPGFPGAYTVYANLNQHATIIYNGLQPEAFRLFQNNFLDQHIENPSSSPESTNIPESYTSENDSVC